MLLLKFFAGCSITLAVMLVCLIASNKMKRKRLIKRAYEKRDARFWRDWASFSGEYADNIVGEDFSTRREVKNN